MNWTTSDFVFAGVMLAILALAGWFLLKGPQSLAYRFGVAIAVVASIMVVWITGAVGIIGGEGEPANLLYLAAVALGLIGAAFARFRSGGMVWAWSATAFGIAAIGAVAVVSGWGVDGPIWPFDILGASGVLAAMFAVAALLFHHSARASVR